jgi:hypothetical protein
MMKLFQLFLIHNDQQSKISLYRGKKFWNLNILAGLGWDWLGWAGIGWAGSSCCELGEPSLLPLFPARIQNVNGFLYH